MRFKKLELLGFKSFAEPTEFIFEPGVTAVVGPNGSGKCLRGSSLVLLADGAQRTISSLVEEALQSSSPVVSLEDGCYTTANPDRLSVLSLNPETLKLERRPVAAFIKRTAPEFLLKVQTRTGREVVATPYHPLFTLRGGQLHALRADELEPGVRIAVPRTLPLQPSAAPASVAEILLSFRPDDRIYVPYSQELRDFLSQQAARQGGLKALEQKAGLPEGILRGIWSKQSVSAWAVGRVIERTGETWGDGEASLTLKSKGTGFIRVPRSPNPATARFLGYIISEGRTTPSAQVWFVNEDAALVGDFRRCAEEAFGTTAKVFSYKGKTKDVIVFSRALCIALDRLYRLRLAGRSASKRIPEQILRASKEVAAEFLSALFEGDAYLSARGSAQYVEYATASEGLARDLVTLLLRFGITALIRPKSKYASNTRRRTRRLYYSVYIYGVENLKVLAGTLRLVGAKQEALERFRANPSRPNPNLDLIPGLSPAIRQLTRTSGVAIKPLRSESPRLAAYSEGRCEASRVGVQEVVALVRKYGTATTETEAVCSHLQRLAESDLYWDEIVAVEQVPPEGPWVYDLTVAETHNFVAENIVVHNSNVADALKWVLGEQSARELRGGRMEDLIFNGSDRRDPIHFAEVSLTIDNSEKKLPTEYVEVTVSRRLFRSGESEYLLNRTPVRLRDIQELFMGTGVGTSAYSLFEQGRIEQIISARPEERRAVFEEAAGITKFKSQKREALRRLEETEENLSRVGDVIAEVKRQILSLERQVRRAKAYQEQFERLKGMEVRLARAQMRRIDAEWEGKESALRGIRGRAGELERGSRSQEERLSDARQAAAQADQSQAQAREGFLGASHRLEGSVAALQMNRERIAEGQQRAAALREELAQMQGRLGELRKQREETGAAIARQEEERRAREARIAECQGRLDQCTRQTDQAQRVTAEAREQLLEVTGSQVQVKNTAVRVRQEVARLETRAGRLQQDSAKVTAEREEAAGQLLELEESLARHRAEVEELEGQRGAGQEELAATESDLSDAQQEMHALEQELTRFESQLEMLRGVLASHEGYSSGVKGLLTAVDEGRLGPEGIAGVLAELIQVDPADAAAVDAGLGRWAEAVVVDSAEVAERCRLFLERSRSGRVLFLIRDRASTAVIPAEAGIRGKDDPRFRGGDICDAVRLAERVGITPHLAPLLEVLLSDTWRVPDRGTAQRLLASQVRSGTRLVTPQGEMFSVCRALLGPAPSEEGMIVGRMSRLQTMEAAHASAGSRLEQARGRFTALRGQRTRETEALARLEQALQERTQELRRLETLSTTGRSALEKLDQEQQVLKTEESEVAAELQEARAQAERWERELAVRDQEMEGLQQQMRLAQETIAQASSTREEVSVTLATARAEMASFEEVQSSRRRSLQVLEQTVGSLEQQIATRGEDLARQAERGAELELSCRDLEGELARLEQEKVSAQAAVAVAQAERERLLGAAVKEEREFLAGRREFERIQAQLHGQEMEQAKLRFEQEQIASRLRQVYSVELFPEEAAGEPAQERELTPEELEELKGQAEELSEKLQRMGPVNLGSIEEERELQDRHEYLTSQQGDLLKAKEDLHQALTRINRTTRALFRETFQAIQREFQGTFRQLFGGGEARLVLMDEEDVLESGIEIIARPPGKPLQPISLLSGGEKALTSIALLFAIFRIKPSPFCLLDEIDAPLDESNIDRFTRALKEFLKDSQFVIITHNKKTMTMADVLYGVTMQEMGVSKIVSVKFSRETNGSGNGNGAHAGPTPPSRRTAG